MKTKTYKTMSDECHYPEVCGLCCPAIAANCCGPNGGGGPEGGPFGGRIPAIIGGNPTIPGRGGGGTPGIIGRRAPAGRPGTPGKRAPGGSGGGGGNRVPPRLPGGFGADANALDNALLALKAAAVNKTLVMVNVGNCHLLTGRIDQRLRLIFHPLLIVELHVLLVLPSIAVSLTDRRLVIKGIKSVNI